MSVTTFHLTSPNTQAAAPFTVGHAFKKDDVPSGQGVVVAGANAQFTPKNYWPNGSLKFAIISGTAALTANVPAAITLSLGAASTGTALTIADLKATGITAAINLTNQKDYSFDTAAQTIGAQLVMRDDGGNPIAGTFVSRTVTANNGAAVASISHTLNPDGVSYTVTADISGGSVGNLQTITFTLNYVNLLGASRAVSATVSAHVRTGGGISWNGTSNTYKTSNVLPVTNPSWSGTDWDTPFDPATGNSSAGAPAWVSGHRMSSWIYRRVIAPHLTAWLEVRLYAGGAVEVLPWIESGYLKVAGPTSNNATYTFSLGGTQRFSTTIDLPNHCRTVLISGSALSYWLGADPAVTPKHDAAYFQATKLVPNYGVTTPNPTLLNSLAQSYVPLQLSNHAVNMPATGYAVSIGLLPQWDVLYLTSQDTRAYAGLIVNSYSAGRYGIHFRDETTNRPIKFSSYPNLVLDGSSSVPGTGSSTTSEYTPTQTGTGPAVWDSPHHPSVGFFAYLVTGRFYFMEEVQFAATTHYLKSQNDHRQFSKGVYLSNVGQHTLRGAAWAMRTLAQACCATPDDDSLHTELNASFEANIVHQHATYIPTNPFGLIAPYTNYTTGYYSSASWQDDFYTASVGYALSMELALSATGKTKLNEFFAWKAKYVIGRLGRAGVASDFNYRDAAAYYLPWSPLPGTPDWTKASSYYPSWQAMYEAGSTRKNTDPDGPLRGGNFPEASSYWGNLMPAIGYAVEHGVPGALAAYNRMTGAPNWNLFTSDAIRAPVWGIRPRNV
jgi:hypothetical protein